MSKKILITGGCGFVGSNIAIKMAEKYPDYTIIGFDNLKRRGSELNLSNLIKNNVVFIHGDIRNKEDLQAVVPFDLLIEAAAEPSVLSGSDGSMDYLINTNLSGTINCIQLAAKYSSDFILLSTSRVYPIGHLNNIQLLENENRFEVAKVCQPHGFTWEGVSEEFPLDGARSPYGATKLMSELMLQEYHDLFGLKTVINRCGVISGPHQMGKIDQGVIVLWMARHFWKRQLSYIGYGGLGKQVRDVLHIHDLFELIDYQMHHMNIVKGQTFNVGGGRTANTSLRELTALCQEVTGNVIPINTIEKNRYADIPFYLTNNTKIKCATSWKPKSSMQKIVEDIFIWMRNNEKILKPIFDVNN